MNGTENFIQYNVKFYDLEAAIWLWKHKIIKWEKNKRKRERKGGDGYKKEKIRTPCQVTLTHLATFLCDDWIVMLNKDLFSTVNINLYATYILQLHYITWTNMCTY